MRAVVRRKLAMARRVLDFAQGHPSTESSFAGLVQSLKELLDRAETLALQQQQGLVEEHGHIDERRALRLAINERLHRIAAVVTRPGVSDLEQAREFKRMGLRGTNRAFLTSAKRLLAAATARKDALIAAGMSSGLLDTLGPLIAEFESRTGRAHDGKVAHVGASAALLDLTADAIWLVNILDGLYQEMYRSDVELRAAWDSARNIAGPFTVHTTAPTVTPPNPDTPAAAA